MKNTFLFLDDIRNPLDVYAYMPEDIFLRSDWNVVRNFTEFKDYINTNGLPTVVSFDHDLSDVKEDYNDSVGQKFTDSKEDTGYTCAMWLVDYCIDNQLELPEYYCHSMNPVGVDKIMGLLKSFQRFLKNTLL